MAQITFKGQVIHTYDRLPALQTKAPDFSLVDKELKDRKLHEFSGRCKLLTTVPSLDTGVCSQMTKKMNEFGKKHPRFLLMTISADLPFAQKRFCDTEHVQNILTLSMMRNKDFGMSYGVLIEDSPLAGLLARSIFVLNEQDLILHIELVHEVTQEPNYEAAFNVLLKI